MSKEDPKVNRNVSTYQTIHLYKRNIPYMAEQKDKHDYYTFGHYDALDVLPAQTSLKMLWENYNSMDPSEKSDWYISSQPIFLTRDSRWNLNDDFEEYNKFKDLDAFNDYPFIFVALFNINYDRKLDDITETLIKGRPLSQNPDVDFWQEWMDSICEILNNPNTENKNRDYIYACYYPLNISQGAIRFHAKSYDKINYLLADLQRKHEKIQYSYTITGLKYSWIDDENKKLDGASNYKVTFDIVANNASCFYNLINNINDVFETQSKEGPRSCWEEVGSTDVTLTYYNVPLSKMLDAYRTAITLKNGNYKYGAASLISSWSCPLRPITKKEKKELDEASKKNKFKNGWLEDNNDKGDADGKDNEKESPYNILRKRIQECQYLEERKKALIKMLNSVEVLEKSRYMHYINTMMKPVVNILKEIIESFLNEIAKDSPDAKTDSPDAENKKKTFYTNINKFIIYINKFLQYSQDLLSSTLRTDGQFFEAPGFNVVLDETPIKLIAVYHACLNELRSAIPEGKENRDTAFLVYPKMTENMGTELLFLLYDIKPRLSCIELPGEDIFNFQRLIPKLAHEMGHCTRSLIRNRPLRFGKLITFISRLLVYQIYPVKYEPFVEEFEKQIKSRVERSIGKEDHTHELKRVLPSIIEDIIRNDDFQYKLWTLYTQNDEFKEKEDDNNGFWTADQWEELRSYEKESQANILRVLCSRPKGFNHIDIVNLALNMTRECFADLVMIKTLNMSRDEYLLTFYDASDYKYFKDINTGSSALNGTDFKERINAVLRVMGNKRRWNKSNTSINKEEKDFIDKLTDYLEEKKDTDLHDMMTDTIDEYLARCKEELDKLPFNKCNLLIRELYHRTFNKSVDDGAIYTIQKLLFKAGQEI